MSKSIYFKLDRNGRNTLILAAQNGHTEIVKLLIKNGVEIEAKDT